MPLHFFRVALVPVALLLLAAPAAYALDSAALPAGVADAMAQSASPQAISEYRRRLAEYEEARAAFDAEAKPYWNAISERRKIRNAKRRDRQPITLDDYVLEQAPLYDGPKRPSNPEPEEGPPRTRKELPVVADFIRAAQEHFQFNPQRPASEMDFKRAYARAVTASGLTREQAVRVYSFETGGNGNHDMQSGLSSRPGSRAIRPSAPKPQHAAPPLRPRAAGRRLRWSFARWRARPGRAYPGSDFPDDCL